jgi:L-seryl-tRNA(Ser) seleniumtransferase
MSIAASGIYEELGVRRVINAAGTKTVLGGSRMPQPVIDAMVDAARAFVTMRELQEKAGQRIAELVGVEAAMVSSGAAGGILLSVAACIAGTDPEKIRRLPHLEDRNEVVVGQEEPNYIYQAAEAAGGRLVHVGARDRLDVDDFAAAIGDRTAAVFLVVYMLDRRRGRGAATATVPAMARLARARGVPVVVDAAGELPPTRNFRRFLDEGVDLVVFSGGKAIRGPQASGIVVGRRNLIAACHANNNPHSAIGRPCKVGKEEIAGLVRAVELYVQRDEAAELAAWEDRMRRMAVALEGVPGVETEVGPQREHNRPAIVPGCFVHLDQTRLGLTKEQVVERLSAGDAPVAVATFPHGVLVNPIELAPDEDDLVAARLRAVLSGGG